MTERFGFHFNAARCTGCKTCMLACKDYHDLSINISFRQVYEYAGGTWRSRAKGLWDQDCFAYYVSVACNHCDDPACLKVCPTGAMHQDERGFVSVDEQRCIGCGYCALSCPYRAPRVDRDKGHSVKCDGCTDRVAAGRAPVCVEACPLRALACGPVDDLRARFGDVASIPPLPDAAATAPNLVITEPRHLTPTQVAAGRIANEREIV